MADLSELPSNPKEDFRKPTSTFLQELQEANLGDCFICDDEHTPDPEYNLNQPGVGIQDGDTHYEQAGVSHLVHAWHEKVKKGQK